jgi:hypothetical protein
MNSIAPFVPSPTEKQRPEAAEGVEYQKALHPGALVGELTDVVDGQVNNLLVDRAVARPWLFAASFVPLLICSGWICWPEVPVRTSSTRLAQGHEGLEPTHFQEKCWILLFLGSQQIYSGSHC